MTLTQAEMERLYDLERSGLLYVKPACAQCGCTLAQAARYCDSCGQPVAPAQPGANLPSDLKSWIDRNMANEQIALAQEADRLLEEDEYTDRCCVNGTPERDCAACTAKIEAARQQVHARAAAAATATERATILLDNHEMPDGDQVFDLVQENSLVSYAWHRCIDWVLWRQAQGLPVKRCGDQDDVPATIDARYSAARDYSKDDRNIPTTPADVYLQCAGETIERWERTPEQQAEIDRTNDLMIELFKAIEARAA